MDPNDYILEGKFRLFKQSGLYNNMSSDEALVYAREKLAEYLSKQIVDKLIMEVRVSERKIEYITRLALFNVNELKRMIEEIKSDWDIEQIMHEMKDVTIRDLQSDVVVEGLPPSRYKVEGRTITIFDEEKQGNNPNLPKFRTPPIPPVKNNNQSEKEA